MIFEWDENKRAINRERHKLDLIDRQMLFDGRPSFRTLRRVMVSSAPSRLD